MISTRHITFSTIFFAFLFSCGDCGDPEDGQIPPLTQGEWNQEICDSQIDEDEDKQIGCLDSDCFDHPTCIFEPILSPTQIGSGFTSFWDRYAFIFTGENAIQRGVEKGAFDEKNIALISGKIVDAQNQPVTGASIRIANQPQFGRTYTRDDGAFDLAVNGNANLHLRVSKKGFITSDRSAYTKIFVAGGVENIVLLPVQEKANRIDLSKATLVSGEIATDDSGERKTSVFFPKNTKAKLVFPNGASEELDTLTLRINEVTQGENGRASMMADLPSRTLYTYAVEFTVDEAIEKNASSVVFVEPVFVYVDNFLGFEPGIIVPTGFYDRAQTADDTSS